jgi:hypothetical protein
MNIFARPRSNQAELNASLGHLLLLMLIHSSRRTLWHWETQFKPSSEQSNPVFKGELIENSQVEVSL